MPDTFEAVARKLQENETALGRLYELFGRTFPQDQDLWKGLAEDECRHAAWLRQAEEAVTLEQSQQSLLSIRVAAIEYMMQHIGSTAERCRRGELTRLTALALARDLENSLLENKLLGTLSSGAASPASLQKALVQSTREHRQRVIDALERVRRGG
jgi:hypothetical protein